MPAAPQPAAPAQAVAAPATPEAPKPADKPYVNPHARIAARAANGQAQSAATVAELGAKYTAAQATIEAQTAALKVHADTTLAALPEATRNAVIKRAGTDPVKQLEAIALLREAGALNPPLPALASTAPTIAAPAASPTNDPDVAMYLDWKALRDKGLSTRAASLRDSNRAAIEAGERKHTASN
jgi:hypothetical protein